MLIPSNTHWSILINYIIEIHFTQTLTVCLLWNKDIDFDLGILATETCQHQFLSIERTNLKESFKQDIYNFTILEEKFKSRTLEYDDLVMKLTAAIEHTYCEAFIVFQDDIPIFTKAFRKSVRYAARRLRRVKFLFAFYKSKFQKNDLDYFDDILFMEQPNILIIEGETENSTKFELKTNKFVGSIHQNPEELISLGFYDTVQQQFSTNIQLFADKTKNLQGREVIMATFDYRPIAVLDYELQPQFYDHTEDNDKHSIFADGTEIQTLIHFCWLYNCTIEVIVAEKGDWGMVHPNGTGTGLMGLTIEGTAQIAFAALYALDPDYIEATDFLGRSGVTCLVPRPVRKSSWAMLLKPFQLPLWLGVILYLFIEIMALFAIRHAELSIDENKQNWIENLIFGYTTTLRLLISQSSNYIVSTPALRILLLACFMIDIVIESVYNGGLASILTIPTMTEAADTVERLARHKLIWIATSDYWVDSIATETNPQIHTIYKNFHAYTFEEMQSFAQYEDMGFAVERLIYGHFGNGGFLTPQALNRLKLMQEDIYFAYTMPFVTRLWPLLEKYNHLISVWHSAGFIKYWEWKSVADFVGARQQESVASSSVTEVDDGPVKLGMDNFVGLILVWVLGIIISIIGFVLEMVAYKKNLMKEVYVKE